MSIIGYGNTNFPSILGDDTLDVNEINADNIITPRINTSLIPSFGSTINLTNLVQNLSFNNTSRYFNFIGDTANPILAFDFANEGVSLVGNVVNMYPSNLYFSSGNTQFTNSTVLFSNSNVSFDTYLPTSTVTPTSGTELITKNFGDATYVTLATDQNITGAKTFNTVLPTSTVTPSNAGDFTTKTYNDATYGRLAVANIFTEQNTFRKGILPCSGTRTTDIQMGGNNQFQYRQATSSNNIGIGALTIEGDSVVAGQIYNTGKRNIAIGNSALKRLDGGNDNIAIGDQAMRDVGIQRVFGVGITPYRCIALGSNTLRNCLYGTDMIGIGNGSLINSTGGIGNVCIGSNVGAGINSQQQNTLIGYNCAPTVNDNAVCAYGYNCLGAATGTFNGGSAFGAFAGYNNANGQRGTYIGAYAGYSNTSGYYNTCLGYYAGFSSGATVNNTICLGYNSRAFQDYECVFGGEDITEQVLLTLPNKTRLACNQSPTGLTINLSFRENENVILTDATTTTINLPTPDGGSLKNVGCKFYIIRAVTTTNDITINPPGGQSIGEMQVNGVLTSSSYIFKAGENQISILCIGNSGMSYMVINTSLSQGSDNLYLNTSIPVPTINFSIPLAGTTVAGYSSAYMDNTNLNYKPSTQTLTAKNISSSGTITGNLTGNATSSTNTTNCNIFDMSTSGGSPSASPCYPTFTQAVSGNQQLNAASDLYYVPSSKILNLQSGTIISQNLSSALYEFQNQNALITSATTITASYSYYPFTMKTAAGYAVTLYIISSTNVGTIINFKRIGGSLQALSITAQSNQPTFLAGNATGTTTATNVLISATQSASQIVASETQPAGAGTFTNAAGSTTVTIVTQTSGTLAIGGSVNFNGNVRFITAFGTGLGGTGTYTINTAIVAANTNQAYTASLTYGWCVLSVS
jgi:hypothetical protein